MKFYLVDKKTKPESVAEARAKGYRIIDKQFEAEVDAKQVVNPTKKKAKD